MLYFDNLSSGCLIALLVVVFSDMFGSRLLSNIYGLATFAGAPGQFIGPPLSGKYMYKLGFRPLSTL